MIFDPSWKASAEEQTDATRWHFTEFRNPDYTLTGTERLDAWSQCHFVKFYMLYADTTYGVTHVTRYISQNIHPATRDTAGEEERFQTNVDSKN